MPGSGWIVVRSGVQMKDLVNDQVLSLSRSRPADELG